MNPQQETQETLNSIVFEGKGILAADESTPTIEKGLLLYQLNQPLRVGIITEIQYFHQMV